MLAESSGSESSFEVNCHNTHSAGIVYAIILPYRFSWICAFSDVDYRSCGLLICQSSCNDGHHASVVLLKTYFQKNKIRNKGIMYSEMLLLCRPVYLATFSVDSGSILCSCSGELSQIERHLLHAYASPCFAASVFIWLIWYLKQDGRAS